MKKSGMLCVLGVLAVGFGSTAKAVCVNPAEWDFYLQTDDGSDLFWTSPTNVCTGYPLHDYTYSAQPAVRVGGIWYPEPPESGSGTAPGLPFDMFNKDVGEPGVFTAHIHAYVDVGGWGHISVTDVFFGNTPGGPVTSFLLVGDATVTGVPEPTTLVLFGTAGVWILSRKKRSA